MRLRILRFKFSLPAPGWSRFPYHTSLSKRGQSGSIRLLHFFCVNNVRLGRRLGIGTRLAAKALREQAQKVTSTEGSHPPAPAPAPRREARREPAPSKSRPVDKRTAVPGNVVR